MIQPVDTWIDTPAAKRLRTCYKKYGKDDQRTKDALERRMSEVLSIETTEPLQMVYLSFADVTGFRGGIFVEARGMAHAIRKTHEMGINPGGEVQMMSELERIPKPSFCNRLLSKAEVQGMTLEDSVPL